MKLVNILGLFILTAMISCSENKNTSSTKSPAEPQQTDSRPSGTTSDRAIPVDDTTTESNGEKVKTQSGDSLMPLIVSFYSIGQGIDRGQKEKLMAYLQESEKKEGQKIEYSEVHWGREGETDFCFPLKGFSDKQVTDFIKGVKQALNTAEHVHFLQNQVCRKGR
jgi:hypothetical protein